MTHAGSEDRSLEKLCGLGGRRGFPGQIGEWQRRCSRKAGAPERHCTVTKPCQNSSCLNRWS